MNKSNIFAAGDFNIGKADNNRKYNSGNGKLSRNTCNS